MKRLLFLALLSLSITPAYLRAGDSGQADHALGVFNFDFARLGSDEASQVTALKSIGYGGLVMRVGNKRHLEELDRYQTAIGDTPFKVYAGFHTVDLNADIASQNAHLDEVIQSLKKSNAKLWIILRAKGGKKVEREQIVDFLRPLAARTKTAGVELVIYPHWSGNNSRNVSLFETAEDALPFLKEVQNGNVYLSLHLSHELLAGNGDRLDEVAAKIKPWLRLPTINGADSEAVDFDLGIQPLTLGKYDSSKLLTALKSVGYKGPVILHTWNLHRSAEDHHHTSFKRYQEMVAALDSR